MDTGPATAAHFPQPNAPVLQRHFGLFQATALNVTMIVGAGVFVTIPLMLKVMPGPYALLGWLAAGALMLVDGLIWAELGAALPGSGGSYIYLLESYGRRRWGRLMAFLFIWQFLISGPLEIASGVIAINTFATGLLGNSELAQWNKAQTYSLVLAEWRTPEGEIEELAAGFGPSRAACMGLFVLLLVMLYRRITVLSKLTVTFWLGVMGAIAWILVDGGLRFDPAVAFDFSGSAASPPDFTWRLGKVMVLAMYSYLGYYNVCYIGDEVRDPGRTIPRAILLSAVLVCVLFVGLHLAMLGSVTWTGVPTGKEGLDNYNLPAEFMKQIHGPDSVAPALVTAFLVWSCMGSVFAGMLGYSRIPFGAARYGHFFSGLGRVHPVHRIPHVSLLLVGGLTLFWSFFDLGSVINALITTRILEQFIGQIVGVVLLRIRQPDRPRPFRIWLYPVPCSLALVGWLYLYMSTGRLFIAIGLGTLALGAVAFLTWSARVRRWPFANGLEDHAGVGGPPGV